MMSIKNFLRPRGKTTRPVAVPMVPFHLASCTLAEPPLPEEQAALTRHIQTFRTRAACWEHAPFADWMLDTLRSEFDHIPVTPERELRRFALACLDGLTGADGDALRELRAGVLRRVEGAASVVELAAMQERLQSWISAFGVHGLPRLLPRAAGALAAWHTATPNPYEAAFWTAEFTALHAAFVAVQEAAARWEWPEDRGEPWRQGWRAAFFDRAHPQVQREARWAARRQQALLLRRTLPQPFAAEGISRSRMPS